jgi:hypothetical protein
MKGSMKSNFGKEWLEARERNFGTINTIKEIQSDAKPKIHVFYFDDLPENGFLTAITCGLANANHPDWKEAKPELIVSLEGNDPISSESPLNGFLVFAPPLSTQADFTFLI